MKRICIIGNSHLAAMKQAIDQGPIAGVSESHCFETFGAVRANLNFTRLDGHELVPTRKVVQKSFLQTGGQERIDLSRFDGVILTYRNSPFFIRNYICGKLIAPLSQAMLRAIHEAFLSDWSIELARRIARAMSDKPVWFVGRPFNAEHDHHARRLLEAMSASAATRDRVLELSARASELAAARQPEPNLFFRRPPATVLEENGLFSKSEYARGGKQLAAHLKSERAGRETTDEDTMHMNGAYGAAVLKDILAT